MKKKIPFIFLFLSIFIFQSCKNKQLTEVTVPLPDENSQETQIGNPDDIIVNKGVFQLTKLPIKYNSFEPEIEATTIKLHYSKIFANYTNSFNKIANQFKIENKSIEEISKVLDVNNPILRNNAGGYYNHKLYFESLTSKKNNLLDGDFKNAIITDFESFENFKNKFKSTANEQIGSGWIWLILDQNKKLQIIFTQNEDNPLMQNAPIKGTPILCLDLWEHAYISENQINKTNYVDYFFETIKWDVIMRRYQTAINL